jgi:hypothetical protein
VAIAFVGCIPACTLLTDLSELTGGAGAAQSLDEASTADQRADGDAGPGSSRDGPAADARDAAPCTRGVNGTSCTSSGQCCSDNCYNDICEGNEIGSRCTSSSDCTSNNCFNDVCEGNEIGSHCTSSDDCTSDNCFNSICEGNGPGARCNSNSNCTSNNCYNDVCQ